MSFFYYLYQLGITNVVNQAPFVSVDNK